MSVRVNLLPQATRERDRASRQRVLAVAFVLLLIGVLGATTFWQRGQLRDAEAELADAEDDLALAQAEVAELAEFADLEARLAEAHDAATEALGQQATLAGILQDVAMVLPDDAALVTLSVDLSAEDGVGTVRAAGETLTSFAPGVERLLLSLDRVAGVSDVYFGSAAVDEEDITSFNLDARLGPEYYTNRYRDGIPEMTP